MKKLLLIGIVGIGLLSGCDPSKSLGLRPNDGSSYITDKVTGCQYITYGNAATPRMALKNGNYIIKGCKEGK